MADENDEWLSKAESAPATDPNDEWLAKAAPIVSPGRQFIQQQAQSMAGDIYDAKYQTRSGAAMGPRPKAGSRQDVFERQGYSTPDAVRPPDPNENSINQFVNQHVNLGSLKERFAKDHPNESFDEPEFRRSLAQGYLNRTMQAASGKQPEDGAAEYIAKRIPVVNIAASLTESDAVKEARNAVASGAARQRDYEILAEHDNRAKAEMEKGAGRTLVDFATKLPADVLNLAVAGPSGFMAGLTAEGAMGRAAEQGGEIYSPKNLAPAAGMAAAQTVALGSLGKVATGLKAPLARLGARIGTGMAEQAGIDVAAGALDEFLPKEYQTGGKYGLPGQIARGEWDKAGLNAAQQSLMFGAFALQHSLAEHKGSADAAKQTVQAGYDAQEARDTKVGPTAPPESQTGQVVEVPPTTLPGPAPTQAGADGSNPAGVRTGPDLRGSDAAGRGITKPEIPDVSHLSDLMGRSGLTGRERHAFAERMSGRVGDDISSDEPYKGFKSGRELVRQDEANAIDKMATALGVDTSKVKSVAAAMDALQAEAKGELLAARKAFDQLGGSGFKGEAPEVTNYDKAVQAFLEAAANGKATPEEIAKLTAIGDEYGRSQAQSAVGSGADETNYYIGPNGIRLPGQPTQQQPTVVPPVPVYPEGALRYRNAERQARLDRDATAMNEMTKYFQPYIEAEKDPAIKQQKFLDFFGNSEAGTPQKIPADQQKFEKSYRDVKGTYQKEMFSRDIVQDTIDDHISHLWKDPNNPNATPSQISAMLKGRRPLEGKKAFTKQRSIDTFADGFAAGLEPVDWNPGEYAKKEFDQYSRAIFGHDARTDYDSQGLRKYVRLGGDVPDGWTTPKDKGDTVFSPPNKDLREYFDKKQMEGLERFATSIGVKVDTSMAGPPGLHDPQGIVRRFGTPESVLAHEIGHEIDAQYGLKQWLQNPKLKSELTDLADLRASGQVSPVYQQYLRSDPELVANLFAGYLHAPELTKQTAPDAFSALDSFIKGNPKLAPLADVKPSLELGEREQAQRLAGPMLVGHYYYPEKIARLIDNHVSPGLSSQPGMGGAAFRMFRGASNQLSQFLLGTSGYHATATAINAQASALAESMQGAMRGDLGRTLKKAGESAIPLMPVEEALRHGRLVRAEWDKPGSQTPEVQQEVQWLKEMGGRARGGSDYTGTQLDKMGRAFRMIKAGDYGRVPEALARALPALNQLTAKPTMDLLVPYVKMHAAIDAMRFEMEKKPGMTMEERQQVGGKIWDQIEDRFGLLTYDNLFLPRTMRDVFQSAFLSFGWNLGDVRGLVGAVKDIGTPSVWKDMASGKGGSRKVGFLISMMGMTAVYGGMKHWLTTGKAPDDLRDAWFPKTGKKNEDGTDERDSIPGYTKDIWSLLNRGTDSPLQIIRNAKTMAGHKIDPLLGLINQVLDNRDWKGAMISNPNDPWLTQAKDEALHILKALEPISISSMLDEKKKGSGPLDKFKGFFGINKAPYTVTHTNEQQRKAELERKVELTPLQKKIKNK